MTDFDTWQAENFMEQLEVLLKYGLVKLPDVPDVPDLPLKIEEDGR